MSEITREELADGIVEILGADKRTVVLTDEIEHNLAIKKALVLDGCSFVVLNTLRSILGEEEMSTKDIKQEIIDLIKFIKKQRDEVGAKND